jgi:hypothetical protein
MQSKPKTTGSLYQHKTKAQIVDGKIQLDRRVSNDSYDNYTKQQIINFIFSSVELSRFRYKIMEFQNELPELTKQKFMVSANFTGSNCLLVFMKIKEKYISCLVERKTLSFNKEQISLDKLNIMPVRVRLDPLIYNGTILDGTLLHKDRQKIYIICDAYLFRGANLTHDKINHKLINLTSYLTSNYDMSNSSNNINLTLNTLYDITDTEKLIFEDIPKSIGYSIKGIAFFPEISGTKYLFMFDNCNKLQQKPKLDTKPTDSKDKDKPSSPTHFEDVPDKKKKIRYVSKSDDDVLATFEVRKTDVPDVYKLFLVEKVVVNGKNGLKSKKMGIAYLPDTKCSVLCRNVVGSNPNSKALMVCKFSNDKNKWIPIQEDKTKKYPSDITEVESKLETIFDDDIDAEDD